MNGWVVFAATVALIALSAFFVVIEFSLLGARRHRLEEQATTSRSARAALKGVNELTMMLAVAQLGITACTFALGAVTKPAVDAWLGPLFISWGRVEWASDATAFALSLLLVTFLHLVVGEMAPKSWAIAHPELSARIIGVPSRFFVNVFRPLLRWVNAIANRLVAATGVEPVDRAGGQREFDTGQPVTVGGNGAENRNTVIFRGMQINAVQIVACLLR
jgi:CBS domain containing-hemolysin-like protein